MGGGMSSVAGLGKCWREGEARRGVSGACQVMRGVFIKPRDPGKCGFVLRFFYLSPSRPVFTMEYVTAFRDVLSRAARYRMIASVSSSAWDHATPSGTTEKGTKCHVISYCGHTG